MLKISWDEGGFVLKRKYIICMVTAILVFCIPRASLGAAQYRNSVGLGFKDGRLSLAARMELRSGFAFDVGTMITLSGYSNVHNYPCPHGDYDILDSKYPGFTLGVDFLKLFEVSSVILYGGVGLYICGYNTIVRSNATGWFYKQGPSTEISPAFSAGVKIRELSMGYHSLRGINVMFEIPFL